MTKRKVNKSSNDAAKSLLTSQRALNEKKALQAKTNRLRAAAMERRIEQLIGGIRTRGSGSGNTKGDIIAMFHSFVGKYLIECKLTAKRVHNEPAIDIQLEWLEKAKKEASNAYFMYMLIFRFVGFANDYCLIPKEHFKTALERSLRSAEVDNGTKSRKRVLNALNRRVSLPTVLDYTHIKAKYFNISRKTLVQALTTPNLIAEVQLKDTSYILMYLDEWIKLRC